MSKSKLTNNELMDVCKRAGRGTGMSKSIVKNIYVERMNELEGENERVREAIKDYACYAPLDLLSPREVQTDLLSINGARHQHVQSTGSDQCHLCKHDLRHDIHLRSGDE